MAMIESKETLCISCAKACGSGCNWSANLEPVDGWTVEENRQGFLVVDCPEYVHDSDDTRLKHIDTDGMMKLLEAAAQKMREDYVHGHGPYDSKENRKGRLGMNYAEIRTANRKLIEKWLIHGPGKMLFQLTEPEEVVRQLRVLARRHDTELANMIN